MWFHTCKTAPIAIFYTFSRQAKNYFSKVETYVISSRIPKNMKGYLGEFEELVLLTIAGLGEKAYGVGIQEDLETRVGRTISIGALHSTITRLEEKGFLRSWLGDPTQERGGRRKRFFELTHTGKVALHEMKGLRDELWQLSKKNLSIAK